ncbi:MAG: uroporphyrinogen decarboxylase family protein, partial [Candidatus Thorarchaeota archaeon]
MKPRDRFHKIVNHEEADRVPLDFWTTPQAYENLRDHLGITAPETQEWGIMSTWSISEELLQRLHIDFRRVYMKGGADFEPKTHPDGSIDSEFGFRSKLIGGYWEIVYFPWAEFTEIDEIEEYEWPDTEDPARMDGVVEWARYLHEETDYVATGMVGGPWGVFEICAHYLRGFEPFLLDLAARKELAEAMMDKALEYAMDMNRVFLDNVGDYLDIIQVGDDLGHQHGLLMSPKMYRDMIKGRHKKIYGDIHKRAPHVKMLY